MEQDSSRSEPSRADPDCYENRDVVFLDVLGFSELVERSLEDEELYRAVREILSETGGRDNAFEPMKVIEEFDDQGQPRLADSTTMCKTALSDSVVFSALHPNEATAGDIPLFALLFWVKKLVIELLRRGVMVRGAVTSGALTHTNAMVFGPAMVEAYQLESRTAVYPRILVRQDIRERLERSFINHIGWLVATDSDGLYYLDVLRMQAINPSGKDDVSHIAGVLSGTYQTAPNMNIVAKVGWYLDYLNRVALQYEWGDLVVDSCKNESTGHEYVWNERDAGN